MTRLAALKGGEVDIAYSIRGELAEEMLRTPGLSLKAPVPGSQWLYFADQWDPKSPWHDLRVRQAANLAMDRAGINKALTLGKSRLTNSIIPESFEFYWQPPEPVYDPKKAKQLLAEAGHPNGFDAGEFNVDASYSNVAEALLNNFAEIGIRTRLRPLERAAFFKAYGDKSLKNIIYGGSGAFGNAATRLEAFYVKGGTYVYGSYPDIDEMFQQQAVELDHKKRTAILHKMQQLAYERSIYAPIWLLGFLNGVGPRVAEVRLRVAARLRLHGALRGYYDQGRLVVGRHCESVTEAAGSPTRAPDQNRREDRPPRVLCHVPIGRGRSAATDVRRHSVTDCPITRATCTGMRGQQGQTWQRTRVELCPDGGQAMSSSALRRPIQRFGCPHSQPPLKFPCSGPERDGKSPQNTR